MATKTLQWQAFQVATNGNGNGNGGNGGITFAAGEQKILNASLIPIAVCVPTEITPSGLFQLRKYAAGREQSHWEDILNAANADQRSSMSNPSCGTQLPPPYSGWRIFRNEIRFNLPPDIHVDVSTPPYLRGTGVYCPNRPVTGHMVDASDLPGTVADYGLMRDLYLNNPESHIGSFFIPQASSQFALWYGHFNEAGCALINSKAGHTLKIGMFHDEQPEPDFEQLYCQNWNSLALGKYTYLVIECPEVSLPSVFIPHPGFGGDSVDGTVGRRWDNIDRLTWADIHDGTGNFAGNHIEVSIKGGGSMGDPVFWEELNRAVLTFPTQGAEPGTITSAKIRLYCISRYAQPLVGARLAVYESFPLLNNELSPSDYGNVGEIQCSTTKPFFYEISGYVEFALNPYGLSKINLGGLTQFALREAAYDAINNEPPRAAGESFIFFAPADHPTIEWRPQLIVELA
jgi:hypothetical protein